MRPQTKKWMGELVDLGHSGRLRRVVDVVRVGGEDAERLLDDLETGGPFERSLVVVGAAVVRDETRLFARLFDPSVGVRRLAARSVARCVSDVAGIVGAYRQIDESTARRLRAGLVGYSRGDVADAILSADAKNARVDLATALSLVRVASSTVAEATLRRIDTWRVDWARMALRRPELAQRWIEMTFAAATEAARPGVWVYLGPAVEALAPICPEAVLDIAERFAPDDAVPSGLAPALGVLARRLPARLASWLIQPARCAALGCQGLPAPLRAEVHRLPTTAIHALAREMADTPTALAALLDALPPSQRQAAFERAVAGRETAGREWPESLLAALPHDLRHREADRMVELAPVRERRERRLSITAFRAVDDARPVFEEAARSARAEDRAEALGHLVACTARDRRAMDVLLERLLRLRNEQDPVRLAVWQGLAAAPMSIFTAAHVPPLTAMVDFTVEARDTSFGTRAAIQRLAYGLLVHRATAPAGARFRFGLETLGKLAGQTEIIHLPPLHIGLPRGAEHRICEALVPWLAAASKRTFHANAVWLADALARRAWNVPALQSLLEEAAFSKDRAVAEHAARLWLSPPRDRDPRVRRLLDDDRSAIMLDAVFRHVHRRRQEWLGPFLEKRRLTGRFASGKTVYVIPAVDGFHRWHPNQQAKFARLHAAMIDEPQRPVASKVESVRILARMPVNTVADLRRYVDDSPVPIQEAALGALVHTDQPGDALPVLLKFVDSTGASRDLARVAMYAMPRLARLIPEPTLLETLDALLARPKLKITVQKEALRLLGASRSDRAVATVTTQWRRPDLHRDVRIACLHAARQWLDREAGWTLLAEAPVCEESVALSLLDPNPAFMDARHRPRYRALLLRLATHSEARVRKTLFTTFGAHRPGGLDWVSGGEESVAAAAAACLCDPCEVTAWPAAALTLAAISHAPTATDRLLTVVVTLRDRALAEPLDVVEGAPCDLPAHARLRALCERLHGVPEWQGRARRSTWAALAPALLAALPFWHEGATLATLALDWKKPANVASHLVALLETRPTPDFRLEPVVDAALQWLGRGTPADLGEIALALAAQTERAARSVAVTLVARAGHRAHWPAPLRTALARLRADPDPHVAQAARRVVATVA